MLYIRFIFFCFKILFQLRHYKYFLELDGDKSKSYRIELKQLKQKIKTRTAKDLVPKQEHVFLSSFYETLHTDENDDRKEEFAGLFCMLFFWWASIDAHNKPE